MRPVAFLILAAAAALGVIAAASTVLYESRLASQTVVVDEPLFPALVERANEVARVTYRTPTEDAVIELRDGDWVFASKNNYPVQAGNVRSIVATLASLRRLEPKTDDPEKYSRLSVEDVKSEGATSRELVLETADGTVLAALILGRLSQVMQFDPLGGTYIREIGEATSWLARGTVVLPPTALDLMNRQVVHVPGPDLRELQIWEAGESVLHAEKLEDEYGVMRYVLVPVSEEIRAADSVVKQLASGIVSFNFKDVVPASEIEFPEEGRQIAFRTFKGMELTVRIAEVTDEEAWVTFDVAAEEGAEDAERTARIRAATEGWAFLLPSHKRTTLTRDIETLTEPIPDPDAEVGPALPPGFGLPAGPLGRPALPPAGGR